MKTEREVQFFERVPERLVVGIIPVLSVDQIRSQKHGAKPVFFHDPVSFLDGVVNVINRNHPGAKQAGRIGSAKVMKPVVVGTREGRGEAWVVVGIGKHTQAPGGKQHGSVNALSVHRLELDFACPTARRVIAVDALVLFVVVTFVWSAAGAEGGGGSGR